MGRLVVHVLVRRYWKHLETPPLRTRGTVYSLGQKSLFTTSPISQSISLEWAGIVRDLGGKKKKAAERRKDKRLDKAALLPHRTGQDLSILSRSTAPRFL